MLLEKFENSSATNIFSTRSPTLSSKICRQKACQNKLNMSGDPFSKTHKFSKKIFLTTKQKLQQELYRSH